MASLVHPEHF
jgi:hypothetical protein